MLGGTSVACRIPRASGARSTGSGSWAVSRGETPGFASPPRGGFALIVPVATPSAARRAPKSLTTGCWTNGRRRPAARQACAARSSRRSRPTPADGTRPDIARAGADRRGAAAPRRDALRARAPRRGDRQRQLRARRARPARRVAAGGARPSARGGGLPRRARRRPAGRVRHRQRLHRAEPARVRAAPLRGPALAGAGRSSSRR